MVQLKLIKGLSYDGIVSATQKNPFVTTDEETASMAVETGYFTIVQNIGMVDNTKKPIAPVGNLSDQSAEDDQKSLEKMTKAELEEYATEKGIDISQCSNNKQRIELIKKAAAEKITAALSLEDDEEGSENGSSSSEQTGESGQQASGNQEGESSEAHSTKIDLNIDEE